MANWDHGGGCSCGLYKDCTCGLDIDDFKPIVPKQQVTNTILDGAITHSKIPECIPAKIIEDSIKEPFKYAEGDILKELDTYLRSSYGQHYITEDENDLQCFDAWIALGDSTPTFRNTALKYLWRYGKKDGNNKRDLLKAIHYIMLCIYVDHYKGKK